MGTVLFAWEMGGGLGHIGPMKVLAEALTALGHRAVFIVKDITSSRTILGRKWPILQTPIGAADQPIRLGAAGTYADIMALRGFARTDALEPVV